MTAIAITSVRSNSLLPEPVAPISSPCGPIPPWADSLMSSSILEPFSAMPMGTRSRSGPLVRGQTLAGSNWSISPTPSSAPRSKSVTIGSTMSAVAPNRKGEMWRARASALRTLSVSGVASLVRTSAPDRSLRIISSKSGLTSNRSVVRLAAVGQRSTRLITMALRYPAPISLDSVGRSTPSTTTTT